MKRRRRWKERKKGEKKEERGFYPNQLRLGDSLIQRRAQDQVLSPALWLLILPFGNSLVLRNLSFFIHEMGVIITISQRLVRNEIMYA